MRYLIGLVVAILIIIYVIIRLLSGGSKTPESTAVDLASLANGDSTVRYVIDNPVQAGDNHRDITIEVGSSSATITVTKGYQGDVIKSESFPTSVEGYRTFLLALEHTAGFAKGNDNKDLRDERGYCANGNRYSYDIVSGDGKELQHYWSTSCKDKTYKGVADATAQLFRAQIPNFDAFMSDVDY